MGTGNHDLPISRIINVARYPILSLDSKLALEIISDGRAQLAESGLCSFEEFVMKEALDVMRSDVESVMPHAVRENAPMPLDLAHIDPQLRVQSALSYDLFGPQSSIRTLYESNELTAFCQTVLQRSDFYPCVDPNIACFVTCFTQGDRLDWHYDTMHTAVNLLLQNSDTGGEFQSSPNSKDHGPEVECGVVSGRDGQIRRLKQEPGTLTFFHGMRSLHRVSPVGPGAPRLALTMCFHNEPGKVFSVEGRRVYAGERTVVDR